MGSVAAAYTFKRVIELTPAKTDQDYLEIVLHNNSYVPDRTKGILCNGESPLSELLRSVQLLNQADVEYIIFACITSHFYIDQLRPNSRAVIINAVEETAKHIHNKYESFNKIGIIASTGTIQAGIFHKALREFNFEGIEMNSEDQAFYFAEPVYSEWGIKAGNITGEPVKRLSQAINILKNLGAEAIISGCTEVPLVIKAENFDLPIVDVIEIMAKVSINKCIGNPVYDI